MFTGIVETTGEVLSVRQEGSNKIFVIEAPFAHQLRVDQSVSHDGACLTVTGVVGSTYEVTAVSETLQKTNLGFWKQGSLVNLERCMPADGRFDGHIVQGHVDLTGVCTSITDCDGSWLFRFSYESDSLNHVTVEKGSICVNGVSLTVVNSEESAFTIALIPYTYQHTNFNRLKTGDLVNLEFDIIGKYVRKLLTTSTHL